jgi:Family of unknown function (DUF5357)
MDTLLKLLRDILLINFLTDLWQRFKPPKAFSWQTLIGLSLFSWLMSLLTRTAYVQDALATMGWLFLTLGVGWALGGQKFKIPLLNLTLQPGPWITGALTCVFLKGAIDLPTSATYVLWPIISALIASMTKFLKPGPVLTTPTTAGRQQIILLLLVNGIISCWFGFHFLLQDWLDGYPSLLADNFATSTFVTKVGFGFKETSRGDVILNAAASALSRELSGRTWSEVERSLSNLNSEILKIEIQVKENLADTAENQFWSLRAQMPPGAPQYTVVLQAVWQGPSSFPMGYYTQKSCLVGRVVNQAPTPTAPGALAQVRCGDNGPPVPIAPAPNRANT